MTKILTLKKGIKKTISLSKKVKDRPTLIAVYGLPNSGKSYLIDRLKESFKRNGISAVGYGGFSGERDFEKIKNNLKEYDNRYYNTFLFHCGWLKFEKHYENPNIFAKEILKRDINVNIKIFNPHLDDTLFYYGTKREDIDLYDIIISNPNSVKKPSPY